MWPKSRFDTTHRPTPQLSGKNLSLVYNALSKEPDSSSSSEDESGTDAEGVPTYSSEDMAKTQDNIAKLQLRLKEFDGIGYESYTGGSGTEAESEACPRTPGGPPSDAEEEEYVGPSECPRTADAEEEDVVDDGP